MSHPRFSIIVPVYNRPQEVQELLESLIRQSRKNFEVIIVEDGSSIRCDSVVEKFSDRLAIRYMYKPNSGPGPSRNQGFAVAQGDYFIVFDSDCILPDTYLEAVENGLSETNLDAWGGPDRAHENFTLLQRAMGYTMSSVLTTGGIRGGKKRVGWFQPRSFNMGISKKVFEATGGFRFDRFAEDIEFSIRIREAGFRIGLITDAFVYHKRRTTLTQFYKQVFNFGKGRALIGRAYPKEIKLTHWFPTAFTFASMLMVILLFFSLKWFAVAFGFFLLYLILLFIHAWISSRNLLVALLSIPSALLQFFGYGIGFLQERLKSYSV
jgi:glycosyltransferase involved in cell wall biosynthesis